MKKNFFMSLSAITIVLMLTGCSTSNSNNESTSGSSASVATTTESSSNVSSSSSTAKSTEEVESGDSVSAAESSAISEREAIAAVSTETAVEVSEETATEEVVVAEEETSTIDDKAINEEIPAATIDAGWGDWYIEDGTWYQTSDPSYSNWVGDSALIVNYAEQTMWAVLDGEILFETPVTTGRPGEETPLGFFEIQGQESPSVLIGPDYEQPVNFWMPFIGNMWGFHDATWQSEFGGDRYLNGAGSRGCINLPYWAAELMYNNFGAGEEVIIF